jgi:uroporphyrin-III C-methyltransferase/precorrin-2 dehydrogenase/sirohydrochlorin ferrochelatase
VSVFPVFLKLAGRRVLVVGAGPVAASKLHALLEAEALVTVVAPDIVDEIANAPVQIVRRGFEEQDLNGVCFVVAAAPPEVNRQVSAAAEPRGLFVNAVDDMENASVYLGAVVRKAGITMAMSTDGEAPALVGLMREALEQLLPDDLDTWMETAREARRGWLARHVPMAERRPLLLEALIALYARRAGPGAVAGGRGFVSLVGAGPGDPGLLTRRAVERLAAADLVLYDALVDPEALTLAPRAQRIFVGKRAGRPAVTQEFIIRLLVRAASRGRRVVRLKGGDPFVFGRGGEEALALAAAGLPFEVVPGISAAIAAPALAGIPVTHRGLATGFVVVSGHAEEAYRPILASVAPASATIVVLMGLGRIDDIARLLLASGWNPATPAAVLVSAATAAAQATVVTLADLARGVEAARTRLPGTVVIGDVVRLRAALAADGLERDSAPALAGGAQA